jgi:hypothetical protein
MFELLPGTHKQRHLSHNWRCEWLQWDINEQKVAVKPYIVWNERRFIIISNDVFILSTFKFR